MRRPVSVLAPALLLATALLCSSSWVATLALAQTGECQDIVSDWCVADDLPDPGTPGAHGTGSSPRARASVGRNEGPVCVWTQRPAPNPDLPEEGGLPWTEVVGAPSPGAVFLAEECDGAYTGRVRWVPPATPAPGPGPPSPEQLASLIRVRLEGSLPAPVVASTPASGVAALVGYPSFVSVTNWSGVVTDGECDPSAVLCVTVTATPSLRFLPGEPEAPVLECAGPGVPFEPAGDPFVQAATAEACAYPYRLRTGVDGRPGVWPGVVTVAWELVWSSTSGAGGSLAPVEKSAAVPRAVDEVQTVVESAGE